MTKNVTIKSKCCNSKCTVHTSSDEIDKEGCTNYYICLKCKQPCDINYIQRKTWIINPQTKIKKDKRQKLKKKIEDKEIKSSFWTESQQEWQ